MSESDERFELKVLGRVIGSCSGWDQTDTFTFVAYDFEPIEALRATLPEIDIDIDYDAGTLTADQLKIDLVRLLNSMEAERPS